MACRNNMKYLPFIAICFMIACVPDQPTMQVATPSEEITAPAPVAPSATMSRTLTPLFSDLITIRGVHIQDKSDVGLRGESALPDGTCILTQLYEDDRPLDWWPSERCALVKDGRWEIQVRLSEEQGAPEDLSETAMYILRAWQKDDPAIEAQYFPFDLQGLPRNRPSAHRYPPNLPASLPNRLPGRTGCYPSPPWNQSRCDHKRSKHAHLQEFNTHCFPPERLRPGGTARPERAASHSHGETPCTHAGNCRNHS